MQIEFNQNAIFFFFFFSGNLYIFFVADFCVPMIRCEKVVDIDFQ